MELKIQELEQFNSYFLLKKAQVKLSFCNVGEEKDSQLKTGVGKEKKNRKKLQVIQPIQMQKSKYGKEQECKQYQIPTLPFKSKFDKKQQDLAYFINTYAQTIKAEPNKHQIFIKLQNSKNQPMSQRTQFTYDTPTKIKDEYVHIPTRILIRSQPIVNKMMFTTAHPKITSQMKEKNKNQERSFYNPVPMAISRIKQGVQNNKNMQNKNSQIKMPNSEISQESRTVPLVNSISSKQQQSEGKVQLLENNTKSIDCNKQQVKKEKVIELDDEIEQYLQQILKHRKAAPKIQINLSKNQIPS